MGFAKAVIHCYGNMLNFSGRASRAEFWWFFLWTILSAGVIGGVMGYLAFTNLEILAELQQAQQTGALKPSFAEDLRYYSGYYFAANLILYWLPGLAATIRRLHDTDRSGIWYFIQIVPLIGFIIFLILMCLPGTHGNNRFGEDSAPGRKRPTPAHPAFASELQGADRDRAETARRAAAKDYYKRHVLPSIQNSKAPA